MRCDIEADFCEKSYNYCLKNLLSFLIVHYYVEYHQSMAGLYSRSLEYYMKIKMNVVWKQIVS